MPEAHHLYRHEDRAEPKTEVPDKQARKVPAGMPDTASEPAVLDLSVKAPDYHEVHPMDAEQSLRLHDVFGQPEAAPATSVSVVPVLKDVVTPDGKTRTVIDGATISVDKPL